MNYEFKGVYFETEEEFFTAVDAYQIYQPGCDCPACLHVESIGLSHVWKRENPYSNVYEKPPEKKGPTLGGGFSALDDYSDLINDSIKHVLEERERASFDAAERLFDDCTLMQDQFPEQGEKDFLEDVLHVMEQTGFVESQQDLDLIEKSVRVLLAENWHEQDLAEFNRAIAKRREQGFASKSNNQPLHNQVVESPISKEDPAPRAKRSIPGSLVSQILLEE